jgi:hypothetical protein
MILERLAGTWRGGSGGAGVELGRGASLDGDSRFACCCIGGAGGPGYGKYDD